MTEVLPGVLAIWNDCAPGREAGFEKWFQHEHLQERLTVPGFILGRRYDAVSGAPRYFNFYLTQSPEVLTSEPYLQRLNKPTPMIRLVMAEIFRHMIRTVCRRTLRLGTMRGAYAVTVRFGGRPDEKAMRSVIAALAADKSVACGEIWTAVDLGELPAAEEERLRGGDRKIEACLMVETLRQSEAEAVAGDLSTRFPAGIVGIYRLLCEVRAARPIMPRPSRP